MVDRAYGVSSASSGRPLNISRPYNIHGLANEVFKDWLGLQPTATEQEFKAAGDKLGKALFSSLENPRALKAMSKVQQLLTYTHAFYPNSPSKEEVVAAVENFFKIALRLSEEATRDEIKEAIKPYLK